MKKSLLFIIVFYHGVEVRRIDEIINVSIRVRCTRILGRESPLPVNDEFIPDYHSYTDADLEAIAKCQDDYDCYGELISLFLKRDCLLPLIEGTSKKDLISAVVP